MDRGELTSKQLVGLMILIISFAIIMLFFFVFDFKSNIAQDSCRNSVVLRGTAPFGTDAVQLQCKTQDVCFSTNSECSAGKLSDTRVIRVKDKEDLMDELALLMYDCWWQMGEGKVDYQPKGAGYETAYCGICNTVKFDSSINEKVGSLPVKDFYLHLQSKTIPNGETSYLYYLYGVTSMDAIRDALLSKAEGQKVDIYNEQFNFDRPYALVTGITKKGWGGTLTGAGIGLAVGAGTVAAVLTGPPGWAVGAAALGGASVGGAGGFIATNGGNQYLTPSYYPFTQEAMRSLSCDEFSTLS